jgi:hypothetical protein
MECPKCKHELYTIEELSSEPEGIRSDKYCSYCHIRYASLKSSLMAIPEPSSCKIAHPIFEGIDYYFEFVDFERIILFKNNKRPGDP